MIETPYPGIRVWNTLYGATVLRLHYSADPVKGLGPKTFVEEENLELSPWALEQYRGMTDKALYRQEIEIDFAARMGQLLFQLDEEATIVEKSFVIPPNWTRYHGCDPHPRVPHAHLWCAVDPYGDRWYYRELWPSKVYGRPGNIPEDDSRFRIKEYVETIRHLESADNSENGGKPERIYRRIIDYAARGMGKGTVDDEPQLNFQERYERYGDEAGINIRFNDCVKGRDANLELVNSGLKPLQIEIDGKWEKKSKIHIFRDRCPELLWELRNNRWHQLTPIQQATLDPSDKTVQKRNHCTDVLQYLEADKPRYMGNQLVKSDWKPMHGGVNY